MTYGSGKDGIVEGTENDDVIDTGYTGDPDGDRIDANDAILGNVGSNDDIVRAGAGNDSVLAGAGADTVDGEAGNDTLDGGEGDDSLSGGEGLDLLRGAEGSDTLVGGTGNDTLLGDEGVTTTAVTGDRALFDWSKAPNFGNGNHASGFTQDTGDVNVTFSIDKLDGSYHDIENTYETSTQNTSDLDADVSETSSFSSVFDDDHTKVAYGFDFDAAVTDVEFRVNDIDGSGRVTILAEGPDGPVEVTLTAGDKLYQSGQTVTSKGGYLPDDSSEYSVLVNIPGPVTKVTVIHEQLDDHQDSGINITDIAFNGVEFVETPVEGAGDDLLIGGEGDDLIEGGAGNDSALGGAGDDTLLGGSGDDTLLGDADIDNGTALGDRALFDWEKGPNFGDNNHVQNFTQDTGDVDVTFTKTKLKDWDHDVRNTYETSHQNTDDLDAAVSENSSFESDLQDHGDKYKYDFTFDSEVANVEFRINDIDGGGRVTVLAEGPDGPVAVTLDAGDRLIQDGNTVTSKGNYLNDDSDEYSTLVSIAGPVTKITVIHEQINDHDSGVNITDIAFNPVVAAPTPTEGMGNDLLEGGEGADLIEGGKGNDTALGLSLIHI